MTMWTEEFIQVGEIPEADAVEQHRDAHFDDGGLDLSYLVGAPERDASEADIIDQAIVVPLADVEYEQTYDQPDTEQVLAG